MSQLASRVARAAGLVLALVPCPLALGTVTLNFDGGVTKLEAVARDQNSPSFPNNEIATFTPASLPFADAHTATQLNSTSHVEYALDQTSWEIASSGTRAGGLDSRANAQGAFYFSVDVDTPYNIAGFVNTVDPSAKFVELSLTLTDFDSTEVLYYSAQASFGIANESFVLGGMGGNELNELEGSATGVLLGGHRYRIGYGNSIYASNSGESGSSTGGFTIAFVPEPAAMLLAIFTAMPVTAVWRRKRR